MKYEIIDNFLCEKDRQELYDLLFEPNGNSRVTFYYTPNVNPASKNGQCYFARLLVEKSQQSFDGSLKYIDHIMKELNRRLNCGFCVGRAKINLFTKTHVNDGLGLHHDLNDVAEYQTIIYYINDNNGGTRLEDGTFIQQKQNRALIVDGNILHESVTQTDTPMRININVNFWKDTTP